MPPDAHLGRPGRPRRALVRLAALGALGGACCPAYVAEERAAVARARAALPAEDSATLPPASACAEARLVTLEDLRDGHVEHEAIIAVEGVPTTDTFTCTELLCDTSCGRPDCCNTCTGDYRLRLPPRGDATPPEGARPGEPREVVLQGQGLGCEGPSCTLACRPFGQHPRQRYRFVGKYFRVGPPLLGVLKVCRAAG